MICSHWIFVQYEKKKHHYFSYKTWGYVPKISIVLQNRLIRRSYFCFWYNLVFVSQKTVSPGVLQSVVFFYYDVNNKYEHKNTVDMVHYLRKYHAYSYNKSDMVQRNLSSWNGGCTIYRNDDPGMHVYNFNNNKETKGKSSN